MEWSQVATDEKCIETKNIHNSQKVPIKNTLKSAYEKKLEVIHEIFKKPTQCKFAYKTYNFLILILHIVSKNLYCFY